MTTRVLTIARAALLLAGCGAFAQTAALQAASASGLPVMLRTSANAGHGISTDKDEALEESADIYCFLFAQLGIQAAPNP